MTKRETAERRLSEVLPGVIRPYTQTELKSVLSTLKDIAKGEPAVAALLAAESPLKDFIAAAFTLSPYLRDMAAADEGLLTLAISKPLEPLLADLVGEARDCWKPG
ncbi:MAG TPA: bifunctional glutamine-synthetase adenylyltransferase/deadenyltransferase, partial [Agrobacterium sp.]|nr:bifunctional glutamine-synthetase adenylyltransferase/deadenyltransferase [Agrobacterium sp.]